MFVWICNNWTCIPCDCFCKYFDSVLTLGHYESGISKEASVDISREASVDSVLYFFFIPVDFIWTTRPNYVYIWIDLIFVSCGFFQGLNVGTPNATAIEDSNALALAIVPSGNNTRSFWLFFWLIPTCAACIFFNFFFLICAIARDRPRCSNLEGEGVRVGRRAWTWDSGVGNQPLYHSGSTPGLPCMFNIGKICDYVIHVQVIIIHHSSLVVLKHKIWILLDGNLPWSPLPAPTFLSC